ncbi:SLOG family protein [Nonomuraea turcica]|uniref:SLOG family protein n=1 Tax=Nonomuraea sp. G32 TaxID=3067274 RepID=UPI00273CF329|nr:SLOG family protein [Nonomuraea sp. G32]MDP4501026.1 SLOG family protein [Nonomuraea sp. G32]
MSKPCTRWDAAAGRHCGRVPTRLYAQGPRCAACTPSALEGKQEPREGACAPLRHYCRPENRCATWAWQQQPWRVLATGGRDREDQRRIWLEFDRIRAIHPALTVVHGAAYPKPVRGVRPDRSADWLIHLWCLAHGVTEEAHPADWDTCSTPACTPKHRRPRPGGGTYCPDAGFWRNGLMVKAGADECVAFPGKGGGTRDCMRQAAAAGIPVRTIWDPTTAVAHV